jgi:hypothetical protein
VPFRGKEWQVVAAERGGPVGTVGPQGCWATTILEPANPIGCVVGKKPTVSITGMMWLHEKRERETNN